MLNFTRARLPIAVGCFAAMLCMACATHRPSVIQAAPGEKADRLKSAVRHLSETIGPRNMCAPDKLDEAAEWVCDELAKSGNVRVHEFRGGGPRFNLPSRLVRNLILEFCGTDRANEILVVGAHYDSVAAMDKWDSMGPVYCDRPGTPGADDNATGVAALIELGRYFRQNPPRRTVRLVAFVNEEPPFFTTSGMGSYVYARECLENGDNIVGMISLETLGRWKAEDKAEHPAPEEKRVGLLACMAWAAGLPRDPNHVGVMSDFGSAKFARRVARAFNEQGDVQAIRVAVPLSVLPKKMKWSDDLSFWKFGYPGCTITDTAYLRHDDYHERSDCWEKLNYPEMATVVGVLERTIGTLANED